MKKMILLLLFIFLSENVSNGEAYRLRLRARHHPEFLRIVLEGPNTVISRAIVNQKAQNIMVTFPDTSFIIEEEKVMVAYDKITGDAILFFPQDFKGFEVFTLKYPSRLVIDVYLESRPEERRGKPKSLRGRTIVIDPGHGGYEYGVLNGKYIEKNVVLDIAKKLQALIGRSSSRCFLTRGSDRLMNLDERVKFTNSRDTEIFLSLHIGNHKDTVLYAPVITGFTPNKIKPFLLDMGQEEFMESSVSLLNAMKVSMASDFGDDAVLVKSLPYSILSRIRAAALMVELPSFEDAYYIEELKTEIANTLYKGLYIYEENTAK